MKQAPDKESLCCPSEGCERMIAVDDPENNIGKTFICPDGHESFLCGNWFCGLWFVCWLEDE